MIQIGVTWADLMKAIIEYVKLSPEEIEVGGNQNTSIL